MPVELLKDCIIKAYDLSDASQLFNQTVAQLQIHQIAPHEIIALSLSNNIESVELLKALLYLGLSPLILSDELTHTERQRYIVRAKAAYQISLKSGKIALQKTDNALSESTSDQVKRGVYLFSSGSSGSPKLVYRSYQSFVNEANRYISLLDIVATDHIVIISPLAHAYALGWLFAALISRAQVEPVLSNALGMANEAICKRATLVAITPNLAHFISRRNSQLSSHARLRCVMAGAGKVTAEIDEAFEKKFGICLSRNYGSTETGAVFAGLGKQLPLSIGKPMPGIEMLQDGPDQTEMQLRVKLEDASQHAMGDLIGFLSDGSVYVKRRLSEAVRRGERFVSPGEVQDALCQHPEIREAFVRGVTVNSDESQMLLASVILEDKSQINTDDILNFCKEHLASYKIPDKIELVRKITKSKAGKIRKAPSYQVNSEMLGEISRLYKSSHILFSLFDHGVLQQLDGSNTVDEIALKCNINSDALSTLLEIACLNGLVFPSDEKISKVNIDEFVALERSLISSQNALTRISQVLKQGVMARTFSTESVAEDFVATYHTAMNNPGKQFHRKLVQRKLLQQLNGNTLSKVLEITGLNGAYSTLLQASNTELCADVVRVGKLLTATEPESNNFRYFCADGYLPDEFEPIPADYEVIFIDNAIHQAFPALYLCQLLVKQHQDCLLVVDDIYLPEGVDAAIGLDWLTHGGTSLLTKEEFLMTINQLGWEVVAEQSARQNNFHITYIIKQQS
ncbi:MAG: class I adenylate-forming enzyme family protein [Aestuariibacter sp.]